MSITKVYNEMTEKQHIVEILQQRMGYIKQQRKCGTCRYARGSRLDGEHNKARCKRNPDIEFLTELDACCDKWENTSDDG